MFRFKNTTMKRNNRIWSIRTVEGNMLKYSIKPRFFTTHTTWSIWGRGNGWQSLWLIWENRFPGWRILPAWEGRILGMWSRWHIRAGRWQWLWMPKINQYKNLLWLYRRFCCIMKKQTVPRFSVAVAMKNKTPVDMTLKGFVSEKN